MTQVPDLVGSLQSAAETSLTNSGLKLGTVTTSSSSTVASGIVVGSDPVAETDVAPGSAVNLNVSSGAVKVAVPVPDVLGMTRSAAEALLKNAGLLVGAIKTHRSDSVPVGGTVNTYPAVGDLVDPGSRVELEISSGPSDKFSIYLSAGFALCGIVILVLLGYGLYHGQQGILKTLADEEVARGTITFLIAVATVSIAIILAISTIVLPEGGDSDKRFDRGKQILTTLLAVFGTIVGFYFGSTRDADRNTANQQLASSLITNSSLPDGTSGTAYSTTLEANLAQPVTWSVIPSLPSGLDLNGETGVIAGIPTAANARTRYTFTAENGAIATNKRLMLEIK